jgi:ribosome-associated protein
MAEETELRINGSLSIPRTELEFKATRSGGPGGQHVNTSATRIELVWDIAASPTLTAKQRDRLLAALASRLDGESRLRLVSQDERSQLRNRQAAMERLQALVAAALIIPKKRRATKPTKASKEKRLDEKRRRSEIKRGRGKAAD